MITLSKYNSSRVKHRPMIAAGWFFLLSQSAWAENIESIVVTGTRTAKSLNDMTSNVSQISGAELERVKATHINELLGRAAGVWISRGNGQEHLTAIRSPVLTGAGSCGAFFMAADGISLRAPGFCNANQLFGANTEQAASIEVVRGPGSIFYGANAVHGTINILSPEIDNLADASVAMETGPDDYYRGLFSLKQTDGPHQFALYGNLTHSNGFQAESGFDQQKINFQHEYQQGELRIKSHIAITNLNQETAGFIQGFEAYKDPVLRRQNPNPEAFRDSKSVLAYSDISYRLDSERVLSFKPYFRFHDMAFLQHFLPWKGLEENGHNSFGAQLHLTEQLSGAVQWVYGVDTDLTQGWLLETQAEPFNDTIPAGTHYDYDANSVVISPFADLSWAASDRLSVNLGLRYEWQEYDYNNRLSDGSACANGVENCRFTRPADQRMNFENLSARLGMSYQLAAQHQAYFQVSRGFRPPQATELFRLQAGQQVANLDSESMTAIEMGLRGRWGNKQQLSYDMTLFAMDKANHIFQDTQRQFVSNGETSHDGIELSLRYRLNEAFAINGAFSLADHEYKNNVAISRGVNIRGNQIDTAPETTANLAALWQGENLYAEIEWRYMDDYFLDPANTARYGGHQLMNLRSGYRVSESVGINLRIMNLLDEDYAERADFAFGNYRYFIGQPRSVFLNIEWQS